MTPDDEYEFEGVQRQNTEMLDPLIEAKLGCYVYVYRTYDGRAFYVGKGGGSGDGNSRVLSHFDEAEAVLLSRKTPSTSKLRTILDTWKAERRVDWFIARHGVDDPTARSIEAALIDTVPLTPNGELTNACRGTTQYGLLLSGEVAALGAAIAAPTKAWDQVFVFQIQNALGDKRPPYEAVRGDWKVSVANRLLDGRVVLAVGVSNGISRIVCKINQWTPTTNGRYMFGGDVLPVHELLHKSFVRTLAPCRGFLMFGGGYTVLRFDGQDHFQCRRGYQNPDEWFDC